MTVSAPPSALIDSRPGTPNNAIHVRRITDQCSGMPRRKSSTLLSPGLTRKRSVSEKASERFLQSTDKRRRYLRRGSKTSCMLRGSFRVELPSLDDSTHSCASSSTVGSSATSLSIVSLALGVTHSHSENLARLQNDKQLPLVLDEEKSPIARAESAVSLLTSALAISSIDDPSNDQP
jgi:hypothetical protein